MPVTRFSSICAVLAIAATRNYCTSQIDIESTYPDELLTSDEVIPMKQPPRTFHPPFIRQNLGLLSSRNLLWFEAVRVVVLPAIGEGHGERFWILEGPH